MNQFTTKHLPTLILAITLPFLGTFAFAGGSHGSGDVHEKKAAGSGHGDDTAKIDYSSVEEHEFGKASDPDLAEKTVTIDMLDKLRFTPAEVHVKPGETVRFVVRNMGKLQHEMVLGTDEGLREHSKMMMKFPGMEHDEAHMAHVAPGKEHIMGWQFTKAGEYDFGCLVPGHFEAGMRGKVIVQ
jgi:uncharacterized cupredoxin-like copper-binding protein